MLLVRSYRTLAPLPDQGASPLPSAVCFCGTVLTVTRTGRYPASLAIGEPGLSSTGPFHRPEGLGVARSRSPRLLSTPSSPVANNGLVGLLSGGGL